MSEDDFLARLRTEARTLRHQPDEVTLARIRARIHARLEPPRGVADVLAAWLRPVIAMVGAVAIAAAIGFATIEPDVDTASLTDTTISMGGDSYRVGE
ncbi:MAG TPA: hypothetical protein VEK11_05940 [Thermoanaerobaculia bacterium]|nr:hypothetical protein [Thermoanaerobaculia bacterium]